MGNYTTPPARRWLYEVESPTLFVWQDDVAGVVTLGQTELDALNDEDISDSAIINQGDALSSTEIAYIGFILAQNRKLTNAFICLDIGGGTPAVLTVDVEWSDDTTTGRDGSWTSAQAAITHLFHRNGIDVTSIRPSYRELIASIAGDGSAHKAWRFKISPNSGVISVNSLVAEAIHLFGPEAGPSNMISFREVGSDTELSVDLDFEEMPRGGTAVKKTFRVKNLGATQANNVTLTVGQGQSYGASSGWTEISDDDVVYGSSVDIGSLAAGALSGTLYLRSTPLAGGTPAELSVHTARIAVAATWV